jgi:hypothetical protein
MRPSRVRPNGALFAVPAGAGIVEGNELLISHGPWLKERELRKPSGSREG